LEVTSGIKPLFVHHRPKNARSLTGINTRRVHRPIMIMNRLRPDRAIRVGAIV
jgi:hypothetical protein